jgi:hypothetical protein
MRHTTLPSPGAFVKGHEIRMQAAQCISQAEIVASRTPGGKTRGAATLKAFFDACSAALTSKSDLVVPTVTTRVRTAVNTLTVTFDDVIDSTVVPPTTAFVFTPARTVTATAVVGSTVVVTATGVIATDSVTYTKPASNFIRDRAGNAVATFTGVIA